MKRSSASQTGAAGEEPDKRPKVESLDADEPVVAAAAASHHLHVFPPAETANLAISCPGVGSVLCQYVDLLRLGGSESMVGREAVERDGGGQYTLTVPAGTFAGPAEMVGFISCVQSHAQRPISGVTWERVAHLADWFGFASSVAFAVRQLELGVVAAGELTAEKAFELGKRYRSKVLLRASSNLYLASGVPPPDYAAPALFAFAAEDMRDARADVEKVEARGAQLRLRLEEIRERTRLFFDSFNHNAVDIECDDDECVKSCAPGNRCANHPVPDKFDDQWDHEYYTADPVECLREVRALTRRRE